MMMKGQKELIVWQKAMDFVESIYILTKEFPKDEQYGLISQMRRAAVAIPSNIAEGHGRATTKDYRQFIAIAFGSATELETQLLICDRLKYGSPILREKSKELLDEILRMLNRLMHVLRQKIQK